MRVLFVILLNIFLVFPVSAQVLNIEISHNEISDTNNVENRSMLLQGITETKDRTLALFSDGSYGVVYKSEPKVVLYYSPQGNLTHKEIKEALKYPYKTYKYNLNGQLENMTYRMSESETFIYLPSGKLIAHWVGLNCYDVEGKLIMTRKILK